MRLYRIKKLMTYNKLGNMLETKYFIQKSYFRFWWKDVEFVELSIQDLNNCVAKSNNCIKYFSTYEKAEQALLKYNEIEGRTYQMCEGYRINIAVDWFGHLYYCYKLKDKHRLNETYYYFENINALQTHIKSNTFENKELISSEFNLI